MDGVKVVSLVNKFDVQSYVAQTTVQRSPNKALECVRYAHRTASPPRRGRSTLSLRYPHEIPVSFEQKQSSRGSTCMLSSDLMVVASCQRHQRGQHARNEIVGKLVEAQL